MASSSSYLDPDDDDSIAHSLLKVWLAGHINTPDFATQCDTHDLQMALYSAVKEILFKIDYDLEACINAASESHQKLELNVMDFWSDRQIDAEALAALAYEPIWELDREEAISKLKEARVEIIWGHHEIGRMEVHILNARKVIAEGERTSFVYRPEPRQRG